MSGGLIDGALSAIDTDLQCEPTPAPSAGESTPTPTAEPTPTEEPTPEPTGAPSPTPDKESKEEENSEENSEHETDDQQETHNTPAPSSQGSQTVIVASDYTPESYTEQIALMQETLETLIMQNDEQSTRLFYAEVANGFFLAFILGVILADIFWKRILR
ncbi:MAG: hypothetical protein HDR03_14890 [Lachnospiraceae bacterium]|nr:hypothetical protein [Lachnospiraceae bacterium]